MSVEKMAPPLLGLIYMAGPDADVQGEIEMAGRGVGETGRCVFNLNEESGGIFRQLGEGITTRIFAGRQAMLFMVRVAPCSEGKVHSHPEEQWGVFLDGECVRMQGGEEVRMTAGDFWYTPGGVSHGIRTGEVGATILDIFSPPREEYRKPGRGFGPGR